MTKEKNTKRALLTSVLSMMLCVAMLIGSTFAWFTDTVTSGKNKIVAGNLDVQLLMKTTEDGDYKDISDSKDPIFGSGSIAQDNNAETLWEPGKTQVAYLAIKNNGNLALKYKVNLNVQNVSKNLYEVMQYDITPNAQYGDVTSWAGNGKGVVPGSQLVSDSDVFLDVDQTHYFALSIHMKEEATNEYMGGEVDFDLTVLATQASAEKDSFDEKYDSNSEYPTLPALINTEIKTEIASGADTVLENKEAGVAATIPANALDGVTAVTLSVETEARTENSATYEINLVDQYGNSVESTRPITVELKIGKGLKNVRIDHKNVPMNSEDYSYNSATGVVTIKTTSFSPFKIMFQRTEGWDGSTDSEGLTQNTNEETKTITIATPEQFAALAERVNGGDDLKTYTIELTADLKLAGGEWTPIGTGNNYFRGTFDGKGHTISGLTITGNNDKVGLIGNFNGTIKDLTITNANVSGRDNVAVVAAFSGYQDKGGIISNVDVKKAVLTGGHYVGTIFGYGYGWSTISDCDVEDVTITVTPYLVGNGYDNGDKVGGLVGFTGDGGSNKITNNTVKNATITAYRDIGGLVGYSYTDTISGNKVTDVKIIVSKVNDYGKTELRAGEITGNRGLLGNEATNITIERPN